MLGRRPGNGVALLLVHGLLKSSMLLKAGAGDHISMTGERPHSLRTADVWLGHAVPKSMQKLFLGVTCGFPSHFHTKIS